MTRAAILTWLSRAVVNVDVTVLTLPAIDTDTQVATAIIGTCAAVVTWRYRVLCTLVYVQLTILTWKLHAH